MTTRSTSRLALRRAPARVVGRILSALALSALVLVPTAVAGQAPVAKDRAAVSIATENVAYRVGTQTIGYSVQHRPITLTVVGNPAAAKRTLFIGAIQATSAPASRSPTRCAYPGRRQVWRTSSSPCPILTVLSTTLAGTPKVST